MTTVVFGMKKSQILSLLSDCTILRASFVTAKARDNDVPVLFCTHILFIFLKKTNLSGSNDFHGRARSPAGALSG